MPEVRLAMQELWRPEVMAPKDHDFEHALPVTVSEEEARKLWRLVRANERYEALCAQLWERANE